VGQVLGTIGDSRFHGKDVWYLPNDEKLGFIGDPSPEHSSWGVLPTRAAVNERHQHEVSLPFYSIARYPATVSPNFGRS